MYKLNMCRERDKTTVFIKLILEEKERKVCRYVLCFNPKPPIPSEVVSYHSHTSEMLNLIE